MIRITLISCVMLLVSPTEYSQSDQEILETVRDNATRIYLSLPLPADIGRPIQITKFIPPGVSANCPKGAVCGTWARIAATDPLRPLRRSCVFPTAS